MKAIELNKGQFYWVEHPKHGTMKAKLLMVSENRHSLAFSLEHCVAHSVGAGLAVGDSLLVRLTPDGYACLFSGSIWTIHEEEPATKAATR